MLFFYVCIYLHEWRLRRGANKQVLNRGQIGLVPTRQEETMAASLSMSGACCGRKMTGRHRNKSAPNRLSSARQQLKSGLI